MLGKNREAKAAPTTEPARQPAAAGSSTIGGGMTVNGDCSAEGFLRIEGTVNGNVVASGLEIVESGTVQGDVVSAKDAKNAVVVVSGRVSGTVHASHVEVRKGGSVLGGLEAEEATVHGRVEGGIQIERRLAIAKTAVIDGDVRAERLSMEEGGRVNGTIRMGSAAGRTGSDDRSGKGAAKPGGVAKSAETSDEGKESDGPSGSAAA